MKKKLSAAQEFEIMKLVLDKFLLLGFIVMAYGLYQIFNAWLSVGLTWIIAGAIVLVLFMVIIVKEYEIIK